MTDQYPTSQQLKRVKSWYISDEKTFHEYMEYIRSIWWMPDWGWKRNDNTYRISTGGWSGNEDVIAKMNQNIMLNFVYWKQSTVGGHFIYSSADSDNWKKEAGLKANESAAEILALRTRIEELEKVIKGMFPLWIASMAYAEHGKAEDLLRIRNYYNGRDNPMTSDDIHLMMEVG